MTTLCANLMQHTRTPAVELSHIRSTRDLMAAILSQVSLSYALLILSTVTLRCCTKMILRFGKQEYV
jgi:hypothetical protein